jgi:MoxR-like ATPase
MVHAGVDVVSDAGKGTPYGSDDELDVLRSYFTVPGGNVASPYRAVWEQDPHNYWRDERYPGRSLQRMRTDRVKDGSCFYQAKQAGKDLWGLRPACGSRLVQSVGAGAVRLVDLAIWYGRAQDVADLDGLLAWFLRNFPLGRADLVGTVYDTAIPEHYREIPLSPTPLSQDDYAQAVGSAPSAPTVAGDLGTLTQRVEGRLRGMGFQLSVGFVARVLGAWTRGDIVVLVGQGGTGKTKFAQLIAKILKAEIRELQTVWVEVRPDFDQTDLLGYERLDGGAQLRDFAIRILQSGQALAPHLVVLEEFNLAPVENYLGAVLVASQDPERRISLPANVDTYLPVDTFVLATCNSYLDEPETRTRLSFPSKRRSTVITMPNVLFERYQKDGDAAIVALAIEMITQERQLVADRQAQGLNTTFDAIRLPALASVTGPDSLSPDARTQMTAVVKTVLESPEGREFLTLGLLKDIALAVAVAGRGRDRELEALGQQVADKIVHQLRGPKRRADELLAVVRTLPNYEEITRLLDRMKSGPGDELLPLV